MRPSSSSSSSGLGIRISGLYASHFIGFGFFLPFFPLVLQARDFDPAHIGYVLGGATFLRILASPSLSALSDRSGRRRRSIFLYSVFSAIALTLFILSDSKAMMICAVAVMTIFQAPIVPLSDAYAMSAVRQQGLDYGRMRLWGSVAFVVANLLGGWLAQFAQGLFILLGMMAGKVATGLMAIALPQSGGGQSRGKDKAGPANAEASASRDAPLSAVDLTQGEALVEGAEVSGLRNQPERPVQSSRVEESEDEHGDGRPKIFTSPLFLGALMCLGLIEGSHAAYYGYSSLLFGRIGIADQLIGVLWAVGVIAEIGIFFVIGRVSGKIPALLMVQIGAVAAVVRWILFPLVDSLPLLILLQTLHGLTFAVAHVGAVRFVSGLVSERWSATGQGLLASASGILMSLGMAASGPLFNLDIAYPFWLMAGCSAIGGLGVVVVRVALAKNADVVA